MPSLFSTLRYGFRKYITPQSKRIKSICLRAILLIFIALILEIFLFNFRTWTTYFNQPVDVSSKINLDQTEDGRYVLSSDSHIIELKDLNLDVNSIRIKLSKSQDAQDFGWKINFTDQGHKNYFETTDYTVGVPNIYMSTESPRSQYFSLHTTGKVNNIKLEAIGKKIAFPIYIDSIIINPKYPFNFVWWRFAGALAILALIYLFRPRSNIYKILINKRLIFSRAVIATTVVFEVFLVSAYLFMGSNYVGVATQNYNNGDWDGVSVVNSFEVAGDNAQQYAELAKSFTEGKLYLNQEPPDYLKTMEDPYDKGSREEMVKQTGQEYLFDVGYYDGHYYVYFGAVPVLIFYLPYYLATGQNFPTAIGVLIMIIMFIIGASLLLLRFARRHFKNVSLGLYLLLQIALVACCGILYLAKFPTFYSLPIACSVAFAVWGMYFWMIGRSSVRPWGWFLAGSLCFALIAGCRPQIMLSAFIAVPLFWRRFITNAKTTGLKTKKGWIELGSLALPFVVVGMAIMWYNYARFGSVTDFGANYNLTMNDMTQRGFQFARVLPAIFAFFIQPPNVTGVFPFINPVEFDTTYYGQTIKEVTFGGVFACLPILWALFFAHPILRARFKTRQTNTVAGVVIVFVAVAFIIPILAAQMAGILQRYYADFSFMLLLAAILCIFILNDIMQTWQKKYRDIVMTVLLVVVVISVLYSVLTCFVVEVNWYGDVYSWAYRDFLKSMLFWT